MADFGAKITLYYGGMRVKCNNIIGESIAKTAIPDHRPEEGEL